MKSMYWTSGAKYLFAGLLLVLVSLPLISFGGSTQKLYVDPKADGEQDGSSNRPYKTIEQAMAKADESTEIYLTPGTYVENITIERGVEVYGGDPKKVTIKAKSSSKPAVRMRHKTRLNNVTVEGGRNGIYVHGKSRVLIDDCVIKNSKHDGIHVNASKAEDKYEVSIVKNEIKNNDKAGVFIEGSKFSLVDNEISDNDRDGVDLEAGAKGWVSKNTIKDNDGAGLRAALDYSSVWMKKNTVRDNKKNGIEIDARGGAGRIDIKDFKITNNKQHAIARIHRGSFSQNVWKGLTVSGETRYEGNGIEGLSHVIVLK